MSIRHNGNTILSSSCLDILNSGLPLDKEFTKTYTSPSANTWYDVVNYSDIDPNAIYLYRMEFNGVPIYNETEYFVLGWPASTNESFRAPIYGNVTGHAANGRLISLGFNKTVTASSHTEAIQFSISNTITASTLTVNVKCYKVNGGSLKNIENDFLSTKGGKMTGPVSFENESATLDMKKGALKLRANYYDEDDYAMDAGNSNIIGLNELRFSDTCDNSGEGIVFPTSNSKFAAIWVNGGATPKFSFNKSSPKTEGSVVNLVTCYNTNLTDSVTLTPTYCTVVNKIIYRFGMWLSMSISITPTANKSAGETVYVKPTSSVVGIPSTQMVGVASGSAYYGNKAFSYQFNTDNAGEIKIRTHSAWTTSESISIAINIPLLWY